jgi:hypothetical protein
MNINPLPKDMTTETPLTDQKWIWGTGMDGSPIEVVSADFARRLEMDRARLIEALISLWDVAKDVPSVKNRGQLVTQVRAAIAEVKDGR